MADANADDVRRVADVLYRYATAIDTKDWPLLSACFADECDLDYGDIGHWTSAAAITEWMRVTHEAMPATLHRITNPVVDLRSPESATARSYVHVVLMVSDHSSRPIQAYGSYEDELRSDATAWRITRRRYRQVHVELGN
jgi:3-phenylpropionate/cinnamic acid dioxygenase small subunit